MVGNQNIESLTDLLATPFNHICSITGSWSQYQQSTGFLLVVKKQEVTAANCPENPRRRQGRKWEMHANIADAKEICVWMLQLWLFNQNWTVHTANVTSCTSSKPQAELVGSPVTEKSDWSALNRTFTRFVHSLHKFWPYVIKKKNCYCSYKLPVWMTQTWD